MRKLLLLLLTTLASSSIFCCTHTIRLTDTWGDGWNGGSVTVRVNGVNVLTNVTLAAGAGPSDLTFNANAGDVIFVFRSAAGGFPDEMRVELFNGAGASYGAAFQPTAAGNNFAGACPAPNSVTAATVTQASTATLSNCAANAEIVCLQVTSSAGGSSIPLTQIVSTFTGTASAANVSLASVYYTGTSNVFATTTLFGSAVPSASPYTINGSQNLAGGVNYFWLVYTLNNSGTVGNNVDATITQFTANAVNYTSATAPAITATNPAGTRTITACVSPGGVGGLQTWLRADLGTTGATPLTGWTNQCTTGTATTLNGSPNLITASTTYNYNPYIDFTAPTTPRQYISLNGFTGVAGINYTSLFFAFQLNTLTRTHTHVATVNGVSMSTPANGTLHGDVDAGGTQASILLEAYDAADFGTTSPAGTWKRNGVNIASNSLHSTTKHILSANCTVPAGGTASGNTVLNRFLGGQDDNGAFLGHTRDWRGAVGEVIGFTTQLSATERNRVESYLAVKYGITLTFDYLSTNGGTIFTTAAPYNNNIIGIGRDDDEALTQKQSHYDNDLVRIYMSALAATNAANTGAFSANRSYVMMGDNAGFHCAQVATNSEIPTGLTNCALYSRFDKEWKVTRSNMADNYNMDVQLSPTCGIPGSVNVADLRLLVDDDGNFANGGTTCYRNGDGTGIAFSYANPYITVSNISTTHIPNNATSFITIASVNMTTPLPVGLLQFDAELNANGRTVDLTWSTASEHNNDHFKVEKLNPKNEWEPLFKTVSKGESTSLTTYTGEDLYPHSGMNYYRLKQVDKDGVFAYSEVRAVNLDAGSVLKVFPNPANTTVTILLKDIEDQEIRVTDAFGRMVAPAPLQLSKDLITLDISMLADGVYHIVAGDNAPVKLVISH